MVWTKIRSGADMQLLRLSCNPRSQGATAMTENVGELQALEARMMTLVHARDAVIEQAEQMIDQANRQFDSIAVELGRAINQARADAPVEKKAKAKRAARKRKEPETEGLTPEEQALYRNMLAGKG